jgi:tetratricopeptide (TPR) repeat protein
MSLKPEDPEIYFGLSILYEGIGAMDDAHQILIDMPDTLKTADVYVRLGTLAGKTNDHQSALDYYYEAYTMDTTSIAALLGMGTGFDLLNMPDSSTYYYEMALQNDSLLPSVGKRLIEIYSDTEEFGKLVPLAQRILAVDYTDGYVRRSLGYALYQMGMLEKALMEFLISAGIEPDDAYSHFYAGRIYLETGDYDAAINEIEQAIKINPDFVELWVYLGFVALEVEDFATAEYAFTEAAYRGADVLQVYYLLGVIQDMQNNHEPAYFYYHKALKQNPENLATLEALAHLCERIDRHNEAISMFARIIEVDTLNAVALNYVGYSYAQRNENLEYALELIDRALAQDSENGYYIDSRGWVFYRMGRYEEALEDLKRASELVEDEVIFEHLGDVYMKLNNPERAREAYEKALEFDPGNKNIQQKLKNTKK